MEVAAGINNGSIKEIIQKETAMENLQTEFCLNQQYASSLSRIDEHVMKLLPEEYHNTIKRICTLP